MRLLILCLIATLAWPQAGIVRVQRRSVTATIALVAHKIAYYTTPDSSVTTDAADCTGANFVVVAVRDYNPNWGTYTVSDSESNTYEVPIEQGAGGPPAGASRLSLFFAFNATVSATFTVTAARTSGDTLLGVTAACFSGVGATLADSSKYANPNFSQTHQSGTVTASAGSLVIAAIGANGVGGYTHSIDGGFTITDNGQSAGHYSGLAYLVSAGGDANPTWTASGETICHTGINAVFAP